MGSNRRTFLQQVLMTGGLTALLETSSSREALAEELMATAGTGANGPHDSQNFWDAFGAVADTPAAPEGVHGRGLFRKQPQAAAAANPSGATDRLVDYYHYYVNPKTKDASLRLATSIDTNELMDHEGDITASVAVNGFHMAGEDRDLFDKLQSAQLRIDMVQNQSLIPEYLDTMAWMSLAGLFPDSSGKLPPLQDLSFNPSQGSQKMSSIVLPGGSGQVAVNLSMTHKESTFYAIIKNLTNEVGRFSPLVGLPSISVAALKGFCNLYGAMEQRTTFLLNSMPKSAYATQLARAASQTSSGLNLVPGDYILVPNAYSAELTPYLDKLEMREGYLVPKDASKTTSVYDLAASMKPDITYLSANIGLKALASPTGSGSRPQTPSTLLSPPSPPSSGSSSSSSSGSKGSSSKSGKP
ncbi:MAG TPA: hypothetical protein VG714_01335 [Acidobacteriaceae bacterium]|nr:hypothetical protein [Acidobacteriaceae bacterium]